MAEVAVRELADHDVPFVKLWVEDRDGFQIPGRKGPFVLTPDISKAAVAEADRHGLRTMAHVKTVAELKDLLRAGVDMWTHPIADAPADEELLALLRERPVSGTSPSSLRAAAECVKIIRPAVVYPYHYRERPIDEFVEALRGESDIEVRVRDWYPS